MQVESLHNKFDRLQLRYGDSSLKSIYGAGCVDRPRALFIFMNPTARNISAQKSWKGLRAPWLGTKTVWNIFHQLTLLSDSLFKRTQESQPEQWDVDFAHRIYSELKRKKVFVTNLAKCTQLDARPLSNDIFKNYRELMLEEIATVNPRHIISFGNQVSSILLGKPVSVSGYIGSRREELQVGDTVFQVYPTYYPVGQGRRNLPLAMKRIKKILNA